MGENNYFGAANFRVFRMFNFSSDRGSEMSKESYFGLGLLVGAALISIPLMWNIEDLEAKIEDLKKENAPMFYYQKK